MSIFEYLDDQLKKEAAVRVPLKTITAAILESENKFGSFLESGDREQRLSFVDDEIQEICLRHANNNNISVNEIYPAVREHLAASFEYEGIENSGVTTPKAIDPTKAIGGGDGSEQPGDPSAQQKQKGKYPNIDVEHVQKQWHSERDYPAKSEHQDFEYGGFVDEAGKPGSLVGTRHDAEEFDPNDQGKHKDKYKMVGGEAGGDSNPESHKKDKGNAKEINPKSEGKKTSKKIESSCPCGCDEDNCSCDETCTKCSCHVNSKTSSSELTEETGEENNSRTQESPSTSPYSNEELSKSDIEQYHELKKAGYDVPAHSGYQDYHNLRTAGFSHEESKKILHQSKKIMIKTAAPAVAGPSVPFSFNFGAPAPAPAQTNASNLTGQLTNTPGYLPSLNRGYQANPLKGELATWQNAVAQNPGNHQGAEQTYMHDLNHGLQQAGLQQFGQNPFNQIMGIQQGNLKPGQLGANYAPSLADYIAQNPRFLAQNPNNLQQAYNNAQKAWEQTYHTAPGQGIEFTNANQVANAQKGLQTNVNDWLKNTLNPTLQKDVNAANTNQNNAWGYTPQVAPQINSLADFSKYMTGQMTNPNNPSQPYVPPQMSQAEQAALSQNLQQSVLNQPIPGYSGAVSDVSGQSAAPNAMAANATNGGYAQTYGTPTDATQTVAQRAEAIRAAQGQG